MQVALFTLASRFLFSQATKKTQPEETVYKLTKNNSDLFRLIYSRVLKTQRSLIAQSLNGKCDAFNESYIAFDYGLRAVEEHLQKTGNGDKKKPFMTAYLGYYGRVDTSPYLRLIVKRTATDEVIMQCKLDGLL